MSDDRMPKPPTEQTLELLAAASGAFVPDTADMDRVTRGLVATHPTGVIEENGRTVWD